jgi:CheY-like chemotaxis protein
MQNGHQLSFTSNMGQAMIYQSVPPMRRTVMVIASDQANLLLVTQLIARREDLNVLTATNGKHGISMTSACQPDIVVMDTRLSDIGGLEALKLLRDDFLTSHIPVIALSTDVRLCQIDSGLKAGFYRYLTKPFRLTELLDAIDDAVRFNPKNTGAVSLPSIPRGMADGFLPRVGSRFS